MISIIVCISANSAIGFENKLLYWLPNDLKRFKSLTTGHTIIMGRKTYDSLPKGALPNRRNIIISRQKGLTIEGAECFNSLKTAFQNCTKDEEIYIIGGASIYEQAMPIADQLLITLVNDVPQKADTFFPEISPETWEEVQREDYPTDEKHKYSYSFINYIRKQQ